MRKSAGKRIISWAIRGTIVLLLVVLAILYIIGPGLNTSRIMMGSIRTGGEKLITAIERYKEAHGALPDSLTDLVPTYITRLDKVEYKRIKYRNFPRNLLNRTVSSHWDYKTSHDKSSYALAVAESPLTWYNSQSKEWYFHEEGFASFGASSPQPQ